MCNYSIPITVNADTQLLQVSVVDIQNEYILIVSIISVETKGLGLNIVLLKHKSEGYKTDSAVLLLSSINKTM